MVKAIAGAAFGCVFLIVALPSLSAAQDQAILEQWRCGRQTPEVITVMDFPQGLLPRGASSLDLMVTDDPEDGTLSGGEQQMLAIGRALMSRPKLLCLDEPSLGLSPILVKDIFRIITQINAEGVTILLVEQNARMALNIADMGLILENGRFVMKGASQELLNDPNVKEFYLGMQDESSAKGYQRWKRKRRWR